MFQMRRTAKWPVVSRLLLVSLGAVLLLSGTAWLSPSRAYAQSCVGGAMQIVAHEDDDLLFLSPDLLHDIQAGRCVRTVFATAGDAAEGVSYWSSRERGSLAAYARMAGVKNAWTVSDAGIPGRSIRMETLIGAPNISVIFMRLPDGNRRGTGMVRHHNESLMRLWLGSISSIDAIDGSGTYSDVSLRDTLTQLMVSFEPSTVRTQDWTAEFGNGDNADHVAIGLYARWADQGYRAAHTLSAYAGYPSWVKAPNVANFDLTAKSAAFRSYSVHDGNLCLRLWCLDDLVYTARLARQYITASVSAGNSARTPGVIVSASSQKSVIEQGANKAIDGVALGYPIDRTKEWVTRGGVAGSWIELSFPAATAINGVVLSDRPNADDQVTGGELTFSDGSTVAVGALANNGSAMSLSFPARTTTTVRFTVTSVSATSRNIGLAELETYANMPVAGQ
ncbi:MAG: DUF7402 domain-containing protein [Cellulomonas sp.]